MIILLLLLLLLIIFVTFVHPTPVPTPAPTTPATQDKSRSSPAQCGAPLLPPCAGTNTPWCSTPVRRGGLSASASSSASIITLPPLLSPHYHFIYFFSSPTTAAVPMPTPPTLPQTDGAVWSKTPPGAGEGLTARLRWGLTLQHVWISGRYL